MSAWLESAVALLPPFAPLAVLALRSAAFVALGWLVAVLLRRALPTARQALWSAVIVGLAALPILAATLPGWQVLPVLGRGSAPLRVTPPLERPLEVDRAAAATGLPLAAPPSVVRDSAAPTRLAWADWAVLAWAAGILVAGAWFLGGLLRLRRVRRAGSPVRADLAQLAAEQAREFALRRPVRVLESAEVASPATWGLWRPVIVLPQNAAEEWSVERCRLVLAHEMVHITRGDWAWRLLAQAGCVLYWFNPLIWFAARQLRFEQELACDLAVVDRGARASFYADHLLNIARAAASRRALPHAALDMARRSQMEGRLMSLLADRSARRLRRGLLLPALSLLLALPVLAAVQPKAPPAPQPPAAPRATDAPAAPDAPAPLVAPARGLEAPLAPAVAPAPEAAPAPEPRPALAPDAVASQPGAPVPSPAPELAPVPDAAPRPTAATAPVVAPSASPAPSPDPAAPPATAPLLAPAPAAVPVAPRAPAPVVAPPPPVAAGVVQGALAAYDGDDSVAPPRPSAPAAPARPTDSAREPELAARIAERAAEIESLMAPIHEEIERAMENGFGPLREQMELLELEMRPVQEEMSRLGQEMSERLQEHFPAQRELEAHARRAEALAREMASRSLHTEELLAARNLDQAAIHEAVRELNESLAPLREQLEGLHLEMEPLHRSTEEMQALMEPYRQRMEELGRSMAPQRERLEALHEQLEPMRRELESIREERMAEVRARVDALHAELETLHEEMREGESENPR